MDYGIIALLPPIIAITIAMITKQVIVSLFMGIWIAATVVAGWNPLQGLLDTFVEHIFPSMGDAYNASIIFMAMLCGGFALLLERGGGAHAFAKALTGKITTRRQGQLLAAVGGTAIFFSDSTNPVLVGPVFRPITDFLGISREKLAYIVDSTTATLPSMLPFTAWGSYIISIIAQQMNEYGYEGNPMGEFMKSVPFAFYTIGAVFMVYLVAIAGVDYGPMKKAEKRAFIERKPTRDGAKTGKLAREVSLPEGSNPTIANMVAPLGTLIVCIFGLFMITGGFPEVGILESFGNANTIACIDVAFLTASVVAGIFAVRAKVFTIQGAVDTFFEGVRQMMEAVLILTFSWAIGSACSAIGTSGFIVGMTESFLTPSLMYTVIFVAAAFTAFTTGTSWGVFAIFLPISIPLAFAIDAPLGAAVGTVISGGIFGDHCSPISDTTVLSSMGSSCDHIDHVNTQLPYALTVAASAFVGYLITGILVKTMAEMTAGIIGLLVTLGLCVAVVVTMKVITKEPSLEKQREELEGEAS